MTEDVLRCDSSSEICMDVTLGCDSDGDFLICMARERAARAENFGRNFTYSTRFLTNVTGGLEVRHF